MKKLILLGFLAFIYVAFSGVLSGCKNFEIENNYPQNPKNRMIGRPGKFFGNITALDGKSDGKVDEKPPTKKEENLSPKTN